MELKERFKSIRKSFGLSQIEFSKLIGVRQASWSEYERGSKKPSFDVLVTLTEKLKVNTVWLLSGSGSMFLDSNKVEEIKESLPTYNKKSDPAELVELMKINNKLLEELLKKV